jgi:hypothetical protein
MSHRGGFNRNINYRGGYNNRNHPYQNDNGNFRPQKQFNAYQTVNAHSSNTIEPPITPQTANNNDQNEVKRLKDISMLPYLERRNLKPLLTGNPRFHLVGFNGVPKYIKASVFLSDMVLHLPEIRARSIISVHSIVNAADSNLNDFQIGFNSVKIIKKLEEILGTGYIELYKSNVQVVIPDIESYNNCEYNRLVNDDLTLQKQPYKLSHADMHILKIMEMLEEICGDKYHYISAICSTGNCTYINVNNSSSVLLLSSAAEKHKFKIEACDTIAITGSIPSALMPAQECDTPINNSATAKLTPEEIVKYGGFKLIFDLHLKEQKDKELNLIKRSLRENQACIQTSMDENENKIAEKLAPLEIKVNACLSRLEEISEKCDNNLSYMKTMEQNIITAISNNNQASLKTPPTQKATTVTAAKILRPQRGGSVNPSTNGTTDKTTKQGEDKWMKKLEEEIDETIAE